MYTISMLEKYLISPEEGIGIALKYNVRYGDLVLGGNVRHMRLMESILANYFHRENTSCNYPARNKVRYTFRIDKKKFDESIKEMQRLGLNVQPIERLERIMR